MAGVNLRTTLLVNIRKKVVRSIFVRIIVSDPHPSHSPSCLLLNMELKGEDIFGNPTVLVSHTQKYLFKENPQGIHGQGRQQAGLHLIYVQKQK